MVVRLFVLVMSLFKSFVVINMPTHESTGTLTRDLPITLFRILPMKTLAPDGRRNDKGRRTTTRTRLRETLQVDATLLVVDCSKGKAAESFCPKGYKENVLILEKESDDVLSLMKEDEPLHAFTNRLSQMLTQISNLEPGVTLHFALGALKPDVSSIVYRSDG
ncbi:hypothetical protein VNO78_14650 [Psophocarpus tetragonolobus]|uniref:Uncharacterized protein n=1 Tax=Psophocarpus tetragonolobus TaxID=3891 RepID=A0AAN9SDU9_PSOTE